jgi:hypothetical protein
MNADGRVVRLCSKSSSSTTVKIPKKLNDAAFTEISTTGVWVHKTREAISRASIEIERTFGS